MRLPKGFLLSGIHCGIKKKRLDLGLIYCQDPARAVGFFTKNLNVSYSVVAAKKNINNPVKAVLVNSGNANCYSHRTGLKDTEQIVKALAKKLKLKPANILIASTGIIGKKIPKEKIIAGFPKLIKGLGKNYRSFAKSILTTDTFTKVVCKRVTGVKETNIVGFAKGAGMIYPNMATMLGFVLTDVSLAKGVFKKIARGAVAESFNSISVDGCTSTNDTVLLLSSGKVAIKSKTQIKAFARSLKAVCLDLAKLIVRDAEGATKFIEIKIKGANSKQEAKKAGLALANSALFKTAIYGENANWGRIISSLGQAQIKVKENISIKSSSLKRKNIQITIDLKRGNFSHKVYTSDLSPKYVKINAEYS